MKKGPKISEAEWEIMKVVWSKKMCTSSQIIEVIENNTEWKPKTVKTLISRLVGKNVLGYKEEGRKYIYYPLMEESECIKDANQSFLSRVYDGAIKKMLVSFIKESNLSKDDIEELKRILDERK
ncbi:CopY/TcrY family copper transport repressor [Clostridiaceae bacterium UIB06]|uniref:CopY/TcrY family copper transport repressor n=1 Tax=Clostridium thailandense TaxID=2794346 RepID=A0A949TL05_9CLOT|nr:CopY/TcrY family copper transport repressor [Clostridium thailandense]MBV7274809.1 CopY/TcrY family copper transport repressor [Clostridium thailandense]MCH5137270.1 CopY/TcrY family copper transport repressor [Clostridiaceae bacterium UIB06]